MNPFAIHLLKRHPERIHWSLLCCNPSEEVIPMMEEYLTAILPKDSLSDEKDQEKRRLPRYTEWRYALLRKMEDDHLIDDTPLDILSDEPSSMIGHAFVKKNHILSYSQRDITHEFYRTILNRGALSLHPHALPLLKKYPMLIYPYSFTLRRDIYVTVVPSTLD